VTRVSERASPHRPSSADFKPRSEYSSSRNSLIASSKQSQVKESSPTSVMDGPTNPAMGVRWSENLTQQQFVSPQSSRLDPFSSDEFYAPTERPKSILRKRSPRPASSPQKQRAVFFPLDDNKDTPFDESPPKTKLETERPSRVLQDPPVEASYYELDPYIGFLDGNGRSVSPIQGSESLSTETDMAKDMDRCSGTPAWSTEPNTSFERNLPSEYQEAYFSENRNSARDDDSGQLSNSYVNFIEAVAAVVIQTKVRQLLARNKMKKMRQLSDNQQRNLSTETRGDQHLAVRDISMQRRSQALTQKARNASRGKTTERKNPALDIYILAAIRIQAVFRGWWVRDCLAVDNYCATMIQKIYRGWLATDEAITRMFCIVRIQSVVRGYNVRKLSTSSAYERNIQNIAATIIQAQWRSFACEMKFLRAYEDILLVQSVVRGWITRKLIHSWLQSHHVNAPRRLPTPNISAGRDRLHKRRSPRLQQTTPPRKPVKASNDLSPSYLTHIEYMKKTLTPGAMTSEFCDPNVEHVVKEDRSLHHAEGRQLFAEANDNKLQAKSETDRTTRADISASKVARPMELQTHAAAPKFGKVATPKAKEEPSQPEPTESTARSEIERRRRNKELEAKAKQEEERRRKEAQEAELAELEFRRKRMAMKAEARKKEEAALAPEKREENVVTIPIESYSYEEKKETDSIVQNVGQDEVVHARTTTSTPKESEPRSFKFGRSNLRQTPVAPWQVKQGKTTSVNATSPGSAAANVTSDEPTETVVNVTPTHTSPSSSSSHEQAEQMESIELQDKEDSQAEKRQYNVSGPAISRGGGIIAARKQQLFMSNGNSSSVKDRAVTSPGVTSVDVDEMNSIVANKSKPMDVRKLDEVSERSNASLDVDEKRAVAEENTAQEDENSNNLIFTDSKTKDADMSALTEPTAFPNPTPTKRVSGTNASYQEHVRSLRSESEQKRIDEMHTIFRKAGLMSRTKRSAQERYKNADIVEN